MNSNEFINEISLIKDDHIQRLVIKTLELAPDYFWTCSASSTGLHHPDDEKGERGTVIHVHKVVKIGNDLCKSFNVDSLQKDIVLGACLLHDICKFGYPEFSGHLVMGHGNLVANVVKKAEKELEWTLENTPIILTIIAQHMGQWDVPFKPPTEQLAVIVHLADYIASREYVSIKYEI
jgi:23S rRNA maturation-related 3'-5' exoribonuclease YhaM